MHNPDIVPLPGGQRYIRVWCDMKGPDGGWILIQERSSFDFNSFRDWTSYEKGFGEPGFGYWLGNIYMHSITFKRKYILRIVLPGYAEVYAEYDNFQVQGPSSGYIINLGGYRRGLGDVIDVNNSAFSTWDRDNDEVRYDSCARKRKGAWWYGKTCFAYDLNSMMSFFKVKMKAKEVLEGEVFSPTAGKEQCRNGV